MPTQILPASARACLNITQPLKDIVGGLAPEELYEDLTLIRALKSRQNTQGLADVRTLSNRGKCLKVEVPYRMANCNDPAATAVELCNLEPTCRDSEKKYLTQELGKIRALPGCIEGEQFRKLCQNKDEEISWQIMQDAKDILRSIHLDLYTTMLSRMGNYPVSGDSSAVPATMKEVLLINSKGEWNKGALAAIRTAMGRFSKNPIIIGGKKMALAQEIIRSANRDGGVDYNPDYLLNGSPLFTDYKIDDAIAGATDESFLFAFLPGAFRFLEGYKYVGDYEIFTETTTKTVIRLMGVDFDFESHYDAKCDKYSWVLSKSYDLFDVPKEVYGNCQDLVDKLAFKIGCGDFNCTTLSF